ncbi:MAG: hypothetical protein MUE81_21330 [Thermoflexibacter sp.]|jgi:hypothetical protein|nr:hypothetical protein [Thermoflexibacter sp.]
MNTKVRKQSEKLLFINWKLREELHKAKEKIEELESEKSKFYTAVVYLLDSQTRKIVLAYSKTYPTIEQARTIVSFFKACIGYDNCEVRTFIFTYYGVITEEFVSKNFYLKESEVSND